MVLKPEVIRERLLRLEEVLSGLEELNPLQPEHLRGNVRDAWAVERGLQLGAEIIFDVGNHILSAQFGLSARDYEDILVQLSIVGVIERSTYDRLKGLGGFRNALVHGYLRIDLGQVVEHAQTAPGRFSAFARDVRQWLQRTVG